MAFFREVHGLASVEVGAFTFSQQPRQVPTVLSRAEVTAVLGAITDPLMRLIATLMYGTGMRLMEAVRLRIKDLDVAHRIVVVCDGKGGVGRRTPMPESLVADLNSQMQRVRAQHERDAAQGFGLASLPIGLSRKLSSAAGDLAWQYLFPALRLGVDPLDGQTKRHHLDESNVQRAVRRAVATAGLTKRASCHTLRHSFAIHLLKDAFIHYL